MQKGMPSLQTRIRMVWMQRNECSSSERCCEYNEQMRAVVEMYMWYRFCLSVLWDKGKFSGRKWHNLITNIFLSRRVIFLHKIYNARWIKESDYSIGRKVTTITFAIRINVNICKKSFVKFDIVGRFTYNLCCHSIFQSHESAGLWSLGCSRRGCHCVVGGKSANPADKKWLLKVRLKDCVTWTTADNFHFEINSSSDVPD